MIKCPNAECGYENVDGTQFCEGCGEELTQAGAAGAAASGGAAAGGAMMKCPACDNLNPADNAVCEVCGSDLKPAASAPNAAAVATPDPAIPAVSPAAAPASSSAFDLGDSSVPGLPVAPTSPSQTPVSAPDIAPAGSGTASPPVGDLTPSIASPGGDSASTSVAGDAPVVAPDTSLGGTTPGAVVASAPATSGAATPFDTMVTPVSTTPIPATGGALEVGKVKFTVEQGMSVGKQFVLGDAEMLVGREDADEAIYPDIDLSDQDEGFVHRRHAQLKFENGGLTVMHLGGANKTRINNRPLPDNEAQPVQMGDKVAFGKVVMRVGAN